MGPKKAEILNKEADIYSLYDLIQTFPYRYVDRSRFYKIAEISSNNTHIQLRGKIVAFTTKGEGRAKRLIAHFTDGKDTIELIFFKAIPFVLKAYQLNTEYIVFGKPNYFNGVYSFVHPEIETPSEERTKGFMPLYHTTEKMKNHFLHSKALQKFIFLALKQLPADIAETLPQEVLQKRRLMPLYQALWQIHFPDNLAKLEQARERLRYEELFYIQVAILRQAGLMRSKQKGHAMPQVGEAFHTFYRDYLPFELTGAQKKVIKEIRADMGSGRQMNRLLQGDVGSGKTLVALFSMLLAKDNGYQACIMAPTEILAEQHFATFQKMLGTMPVRVELLTGMVKGKRRKAVMEGLQTGEVQILVGTHAVIEDNVQFRNLGLVVIDEQHRFGVAQRAKLWEKNLTPPHVLVMTATPIPRTLAMTLYGDLDVSIIDELPPGRKPIQTMHMYDNNPDKLYRGINQQIQEGRQVYMVYPLVKESEKLDLKNVEEAYVHLQKIFPQYRISMVHGQMKPVDKDAEMQRFVSGETQILVATTVIEVGVNVPNATLMVVENAERFGLSQLHQLRGRVGRGAAVSYCFLMAEPNQRLRLMTKLRGLPMMPLSTT